MTTIRIVERAGTFAEDKDIAARMREEDLRPALDRAENVRIDFRGVDGATQSFVHALVSELIRKNGPSVLDQIEFRKCNPTVRSVVEIVVEYSQLVEDSEDAKGTDEETSPRGGRAQRRGSPAHRRNK